MMDKTMIRFFKKKTDLRVNTHITAINGLVIARPEDRVNQNFMNQLIIMV